MKPPLTYSAAKTWLHLLLDSVWRTWMVVAAALFQLAVAAAAILEGKKAAHTPATSSSIYFILLWTFVFAQNQYVSYPLLGTLPLSRKTRGRLVWVQHVLVIPVLYVAFLVPLVVIQSAAGSPPSYTLLETTLLACTIMPPALLLLIRPGGLLRIGYLVIAIPIAGIFLAVYVYRRAVAGDALALALWPYLAAACALIVLLSWMRAPRLLVGPGRTRPAPSWMRFRSPLEALGSGIPGPAISRLGPLWQMALIEPLRVLPVVLLLSAVAILWVGSARDTAGVLLAIVAAAVTFFHWARCAVRAAERARLLRALPVTPGQLALTIMANAAAGGLYAAIAGALALTAAGAYLYSPLLSAVLLATCLGAFMPAVYVRFSDNPLIAGYVMAIATVAAMILINPIVLFLEGGAALLLLLLTPFVFLIATNILRFVLLSETAYHYRKPPIQAMSEGM